jgi:hypothetical protein
LFLKSNCKLKKNVYPEEYILGAIRRSLRGEAAVILKRLRLRASVGLNLSKFNSTYAVKRKLYASEPGPTASFTKYASKAEEISIQTVESQPSSYAN